jgi:cell division protein FtsB
VARRPASPSSVSPRTPPRGKRAARPVTAERRAGTAPERRVDVRGWLGGVRLSGFMVVMMSLVVLAAFVLVPTFGNFVQQRQKIAALEASVVAGQDEVERLTQQQERWGDPAYITTQARERLYYMRPGEVVYLIVNDLPPALQPADEKPVSADVVETPTNWMTQMLASVTTAGLAQTVTEPTIGVPDPEPSTDVPAP